MNHHVLGRHLEPALPEDRIQRFEGDDRGAGFGLGQECEDVEVESHCWLAQNTIAIASPTAYRSTMPSASSSFSTRKVSASDGTVPKLTPRGVQVNTVTEPAVASSPGAVGRRLRATLDRNRAGRMWVPRSRVLMLAFTGGSRAADVALTPRARRTRTGRRSPAPGRSR